MRVIDRGSGDLKPTPTISRPALNRQRNWPLRRMFVVVFIVCLATWVIAIAYILSRT